MTACKPMNNIFNCKLVTPTHNAVVNYTYMYMYNALRFDYFSTCLVK